MARFKKAKQIKEIFLQGSESLIQLVYGADFQNNLRQDDQDNLLEKAEQYFEQEKDFLFESIAEVIG